MDSSIYYFQEIKQRRGKKKTVSMLKACLYELSHFALCVQSLFDSLGLKMEAPSPDKVKLMPFFELKLLFLSLSAEKLEKNRIRN